MPNVVGSATWRFLFLTLVGSVILWLYTLFAPSVTQDNGAVYYLRPGTSKQLLLKELNEQHLLRYPSAFACFIYPQFFVQLKTGEYYFPKHTSAFGLWRQIITGKGFYMREFIIVPGTTFKQLREILLKTETLHHTSKVMDEVEIMSLLGNPSLSPEGEFFPETYYYTRGIHDMVILQRSYDLMQQRSQEAWAMRDITLPYRSSYEALIAASLIEKEAYLKEERAIISGVLVNRLRANMLLQFDPSVIYGMRDDGSLRKIQKKDLKRDTPFNTYLHKGLPPTPICMPSMASIEATLHPQVHSYYYFVSKGDGSHQFSRTLAEHNNAVAISIKKTNTNNRHKVLTREQR